MDSHINNLKYKIRRDGYMLLKDVEKHVCGSEKNGIVYPLYDGYSLANVSNTALDLLGAKPVGKTLDKSIIKHIDTKNIKKIVVLLLDGFGYDMFLKSLEYASFFRKVADNGIFAPITSGFPSTTAASITTINSGLTPKEHGLIEWTLYFDEIDQIINTLPFTSLTNESLKGKENPKILYSGITIYGNAKKSKVNTYTLLDSRIASSEYNKQFSSKKTSETHIKNSDFAIKLRRILENEKDRSYFYVYLNGIDSLAHAYGSHTEESEAEILSISHSLEDGFLSKLSKKTASETLLIITADHGHTSIKPENVLYLNKYKKLNSYYDLGRNGKPILPYGGPRDVFMHIKPEKLEEAYAFLSKKLSKTAKVVKLNDSVIKTLFGNEKPNKKFKSRVGNLLILPYSGRAVWYKHLKESEWHYVGVHGGLSPEEMLIPFAAVRLSKIL